MHKWYNVYLWILGLLSVKSIVLLIREKVTDHESLSNAQQNTSSPLSSRNLFDYLNSAVAALCLYSIVQYICQSEARGLAQVCGGSL